MMNSFSLDGILNEAMSWMPQFLKVVIVLFIGWLIAKGLQKLTYKLLNKTGLDEKIIGGGNNINSEKMLSKLVYYLVMAIVLMAVLSLIGAEAALEPLQNMVSEFLSSLPNIIKAFIIGMIGYIVAQTVSALVSLSGNVMDRVALKAGINDTMKLTNILKNIVFIVIIIPFAIAALDALQIPSISDPAKSMLQDFMAAIPNIVAASIILAVFYYGGKFLSSILLDLLNSLGVNEMAKNLKLDTVLGNKSFAKVLSQLAFFFIVFFGLITAVNKLGFDPLTEILNLILGYMGSILFGLIIFAFGTFLANIAYKTISKEGESVLIPSVVKGAVLALFFAMGLRTMGFANEIVHLAFGLILGSIAVAFALSFGLGGQKAAGELMEDVFSKFKSKK